MGKMPNKSLWCEWDLYSHLLWFHISLSCYLWTCPSFEAPGERYPSAKLNLSKIYICRILESVGKIHQTPRSSYELVDTWSLIGPFRTKLGNDDKNPSEQGRDPIPKMIPPTHSRRLRPTKKKREGRQVVSHWLFLSVTPFAYRMFDVF